MKIAIIQSCYLPWRGYFDIINDVDTFVFLDDVQLTKRDWRTRNLIKTDNGLQWITLPVRGGREQRICEAQLDGDDWQKRHLAALRGSYAKAPYFEDFPDLMHWLYATPHAGLSDFNRETTRRICDVLGIRTPLLNAVDLAAGGRKTEHLIAICRALKADAYLSGPTARAYIEEEKFAEAGIRLEYKAYPTYPEYPQLFPPFVSNVTILDVLFNCGRDARRAVVGD